VAALAARIIDFIASGDRSEPAFDGLARAVFEFQFDRNPPYRRYCESLGASPAALERWSSIPAVITSAFKAGEWTVLPPAGRTRVFHSSGTTAQQRSRHFHSAESLQVYETSLLAWFKPHVLPDLPQARFAFLAPPPQEAPNSSLVHMFDTMSRAFGPATWHATVDADAAWILDSESFTATFDRVTEPVVVCGAAFSFVHLHDWLQARGQTLRLPPGSRAFETGGYKGRSRTVPRDELHQMISRALGLPDAAIVAEYGMSELSSQAYDRTFGTGSPRTFRFPPWARATVISPETGRPADEGEAGLLRVCDLANVASVMAIQTEDLAVRRGDGFELLGRALHAEPRGCSLMPAA
jgi:hypothetical protein